mgnify:FL=1
MQLSVRVRLMLWIKMTSRPTWVKPMSRYVHLRTFLIDGLPTIYRNVGAYVGRAITPDDMANITEIYCKRCTRTSMWARICRWREATVPMT